jgi:two-component system nitrogen regulation sensor histidine kinase NtrY
VSAAVEGEQVRVSVSDNGKGWPKENRNRLLEPYITTREKGTGLGLAIVARIIEQHGGKVELIDSEPDANGRVGASFVFRLPIKPPEKDEEEESQDRSEGRGAAPAEDGAALSEAGSGGQPETSAGKPPLQAVTSE